MATDKFDFASLYDRLSNDLAALLGVMTETLTAAGAVLSAALSINAATADAQAFVGTATQLTTSRTSGDVAAFKGTTTSLSGDSGGDYSSFLAAAPTDGGGSGIHYGLKAEAGNDHAVWGEDNAALTLGTGKDWTVLHNATNTVMTSATGDFIIDNTGATGATYLDLGTDTSLTEAGVRNNTGTSLWKVQGDGTIVAGASTRDTSHHLRWVEHDELYSKADTEAEHGWILNSGSDAQAIDPAVDTAQAGGVWQLVTGNLDGSTAADASGMVWADMPIQLDSGGGVVSVEARIRIKSALTFASVGFGLTDATTLEEPFTNSADTVTAVADDAVGFLYDTDATTDTWWGCAVDTTTLDTGTATTGTAPTADAWQILRIEISADGVTVNFFIDNAVAASLALSAAAGVGPNVVLYPYLIANTTAGTPATVTVDVDWVRVQGVR